MECQAHMLTSNIYVHEGTFFSQEKFIQAVACAEMANVSVLKLQSANSPAHLFGLEHIRTRNRRSVSLAPFGLPAYPIGACQLNDSISVFLRQLKTLRTTGFEWNVRFDHHDLAKQLEGCGLSRFNDTTHVLYLSRPYDDIFRKFSESARNKIRRAIRKGVAVYSATEAKDVSTYYQIYKKMIAERSNWGVIHKESLFRNLFNLKEDVILLLAKLDGVVLSGGWFIRDGNSFRYWQGAMNYYYKSYFPQYAVIDHAIRLACSDNMSSFDFGQSRKIPSLEQFKSFWATQKVPCWTFLWENPIWLAIYRIRTAINFRKNEPDLLIPWD
jgi:hypothetical protein